MPNYSPNLGLVLPVVNEFPGTWGNEVNNGVTSLVEQAISGYTTQSVATGTDTTISIPSGSTGVARNMYIQLSGTGGASTNLIVPANRKLYFIFNNTAGPSGQVTVKVAGQTGVSVPSGAKMLLVCNGTDIVDAVNYFNFTGNIVAAAFIPTGSTVPTNGLYLPGTNIIGFSTNSTTRGNISATGQWTIAAPTSGGPHTVNLLAGTNGIEFKAGSCTYNIYIDGSNNAYSGTTTANQLNMVIGGVLAATWESGGGLDIKAPTTTTLPGLKVSGAAFTPPVVVTFSATAMTVNCALSNIFTTTFTANVTVAPSIDNPSNGQTLNWFITQDATGSRTMTWPSSFKWPGGVAPLLSTAANAVDLLVATYRSGTGFWYATLTKAFS
jgi:hypothetical protein